MYAANSSITFHYQGLLPFLNHDTFHNKLLFQFISRLAEKTKGIQQEEANRQRREEKQ